MTPEKNPNILQGKKKKERERGKTEKIKVNRVASQDCILSPCLYNFYAEYIMQNARLDEAQAGLKIAGKNINNLRCTDDTTLMAQGTEELRVQGAPRS